MGRLPSEGAKVGYALGVLMGMCICNDHRWPETYRVMGLQGVEMVLLGYNTPVHNPPAPSTIRWGTSRTSCRCRRGRTRRG